MSMSTIGIIGLGPMGHRYVEAIQMLLEPVKIAVTDLRTEVIEQAKAKYPTQEFSVYTNHEDMLKSEQLDVLIIATNGPSHYSLFLDAIKFGVNRVICEKPIATSIHQAQEMVSIAREKGVKLAVNHGRRWAADYLLLREKLKFGVIGPVESMMFSMGGGQMGCNGTHFIDLASFLLDDQVEQVCGFLNDEGVPNPRGAHFKDPGGYAILHFRAGTRMFFELTEDLGIPPVLVINGKYGRITVNELQRSYFIEARNEQDRELPVTRYGTPLHETQTCKLELNIIEFCQNLLMNMLQDRIPANPQCAVDALETVIGIHYSHHLGNKVINLPITDEEYCNKLFSFT